MAVKIERMTVEQLLGIDKFEVDDGQAHITLNKEHCARCKTTPCVYACPAGLYRLADGQISFDCAGCLECGTCRVVCPMAGTALVWNYPRGGFGVQYRYG